jgi:uncharacterized peroxidase-related enzyme
MSRLPIPTQDETPAESQKILDAVGRQLGRVPNLFRVMGRSTAVLEGYSALSAALRKTLDAKTRERISIAVAVVNGCDYCLSAHTYLAANVTHLDEAEIAANRHGHSNDAKADAAVAFAAAVAQSRGKVSDASIAAVRNAGFTDAQVVEIVANVALATLTNFVNNVADTDIDFPVVRADAA